MKTIGIENGDKSIKLEEELFESQAVQLELVDKLKASEENNL